MDSDFDVDESMWHMEEGLGEEQLEEKKKKKQWLKPSKPKVCALREREGGGERERERERERVRERKRERVRERE